MGGHSAWRKREARGELAKGAGGAICRHRPHLGRKGKDLILNRKGHIAGGNPKRKSNKNRNGDEAVNPDGAASELEESGRFGPVKSILSHISSPLVAVSFIMVMLLVLAYRGIQLTSMPK